MTASSTLLTSCTQLLMYSEMRTVEKGQYQLASEESCIV